MLSYRMKAKKQTEQLLAISKLLDLNNKIDQGHIIINGKRIPVATERRGVMVERRQIAEMAS